MSYGGDAYAYTLCCAADAQHVLNNSCANASKIDVFGVSATTNAHIQNPDLFVGVYNELACMAATPGGLNCEYSKAACSAGYGPVASMANSEGPNATNAHIANYSYYTANVCCKIDNSAPTVPVLGYPLDGNDSVFEREIVFDWADSTDADGDDITYDYNLSQATCAGDYQTGLATSTYTSSTLCVDKLYNWTVRACDEHDACSAWASVWEFTIASTLGLNFTVNETDFVSVARNGTDNTTDNDPPPFTVENTGNVPLNVTFKALDALFTTSGLGNDTFQYKAREDEAGAYGSAQTDWENVSVNYTALFTNLGYAAAADSAFVDVLIHSPYEEPAGAKSSIVQVLGNYTG